MVEKKWKDIHLLPKWKYILSELQIVPISPFQTPLHCAAFMLLIVHQLLQISRKTAHLVLCLQPPIQNYTDLELPAKKTKKTKQNTEATLHFFFTSTLAPHQ